MLTLYKYVPFTNNVLNILYMNMHKTNVCIATIMFVGCTVISEYMYVNVYFIVFHIKCLFWAYIKLDGTFLYASKIIVPVLAYC